MTTQVITVFRSALDESIEVSDMGQAVALYEAHPTDSRYSQWVDTYKLVEVTQ